MRTLGIDIGNLMARMAVQTSCIEYIISLVNDLDQSGWKHDPVQADDGGEPAAYVSTLPGTEMNKLMTILALLRSLE